MSGLDPKETVRHFLNLHEETYAPLLPYAALPLILTPELLHFLRHTFAPQTPWIAEADILLDENLCRQYSTYEQFLMHAPIRAHLLEQARQDPKFRRADASRLLLDYLRNLERTRPYHNPRELQAQSWSAMVYIDDTHRGLVFEEIKDAFRRARQRRVQGYAEFIGATELTRLEKITEQLAAEMAQYPALVEYSRQIRDLIQDAPTTKLKSRLTFIHDLAERGNIGATLAARDAILIIELIMRQLLCHHIKYLPPKAQIEVNQTVTRFAKGSRARGVADFTLGQLIGVIRDSHFFDLWSAATGKQMLELRRIDLNALVRFRNHLTHSPTLEQLTDHVAQIKPATAQFLLHCIDLLVNSFGIESLENLPSGHRLFESTTGNQNIQEPTLNMESSFPLEAEFLGMVRTEIGKLLRTPNLQPLSNLLQAGSALKDPEEILVPLDVTSLDIIHQIDMLHDATRDIFWLLMEEHRPIPVVEAKQVLEWLLLLAVRDDWVQANTPSKAFSSTKSSKSIAEKYSCWAEICEARLRLKRPRLELEPGSNPIKITAPNRIFDYEELEKGLNYEDQFNELLRIMYMKIMMREPYFNENWKAKLPYAIKQRLEGEEYYYVTIPYKIYAKTLFKLTRHELGEILKLFDVFVYGATENSNALNVPENALLAVTREYLRLLRRFE